MQGVDPITVPHRHVVLELELIIILIKTTLDYQQTTTATGLDRDANHGPHYPGMTALTTWPRSYER